LIGKKLPLYKMEEEEVMTLQERVTEAQRNSKMELKAMEESGKGRKRKFGDNDGDDMEDSVGVRKRIKGKQKGKKKFGGKKKKK